MPHGWTHTKWSGTWPWPWKEQEAKLHKLGAQTLRCWSSFRLSNHQNWHPFQGLAFCSRLQQLRRRARSSWPSIPFNCHWVGNYWIRLLTTQRSPGNQGFVWENRALIQVRQVQHAVQQGQRDVSKPRWQSFCTRFHASSADIQRSWLIIHNLALFKKI
jgi:hypothetical protein